MGLLWYWVACCIDLWRKQREALLPHWRYGRLLIDALLIAMGYDGLDFYYRYLKALTSARP